MNQTNNIFFKVIKKFRILIIYLIPSHNCWKHLWSIFFTFFISFWLQISPKCPRNVFFAPIMPMLSRICGITFPLNLFSFSLKQNLSEKSCGWICSLTISPSMFNLNTSHRYLSEIISETFQTNSNQNFYPSFRWKNIFSIFSNI